MYCLAYFCIFFKPLSCAFCPGDVSPLSVVVPPRHALSSQSLSNMNTRDDGIIKVQSRCQHDVSLGASWRDGEAQSAEKKH